MNKSEKIPFYLLLGFAISSIGGPLAFVALYLVNAAGAAFSSLGFVTVIGALLFLFPILIWYNYSTKIASSGGLYEFVRQSYGERLAKIQGWIWSFSYFLYLPYTVSYIVFFILPVFFVVPKAYLYGLEILLPVTLSAVMILNKKMTLSMLFIGAVFQLLIITLLALLVSARTGLSFVSLQPNISTYQLFQGSFGVSVLFICANLQLFLGGEVKNGKKVIGKTLLISFLVVALFVIFASILLFPGISGNVEQSAVPGFALANIYSSPFFASVLGIFVLVSIATLIIAEFFALSRVIHTMLNIDLQKTMYGVAAGFILLDLVSLIDPYKFYYYILPPSLVALYISQLIPVLVYPSFLKKFFSKISIIDLIMVAVSAALMLYGLVSVISGISIT